MTLPAAAAAVPDFEFRAARQPLFWAACAYSLGIIAGVDAWRPALWWFVGIAIFALAAAYFTQRKSTFAWALALSALFLAGAIHIQLRRALRELDTSIQAYADRQEVGITAHVIRNGKLRVGAPGETRQSVDFETESVQTAEGLVVPLQSGIRLNIYSRQEDEDGRALGALYYGQRIRAIVKLRRPRNFRNPGAFDYEGYLAKMESQHWDLRKLKMSRCLRDSPEHVLVGGAAACIAE